MASHVFSVASAEQGIAAWKNGSTRLVPPRLSQLGITDADLPATIENVLGNAHYFGLADTYTRDVVSAILHSAR